MTSTHACDQILSGLFLGSLEAEQSPLEDLKLLGITHILRLGCTSFPKTHPDDLCYLEIDVVDLPDADLLGHLRDRDTNGFIDVGRIAGGVLVHCMAGISRSATTVITYMMCKQQIGYTEALAALIARRTRISPNPGFMEQLKVLEVECGCDINKYEKAPRAHYLSQAEREARGKDWLAQREAASLGVSATPVTRWTAKPCRSIFPPGETPSE